MTTTECATETCPPIYAVPEEKAEYLRAEAEEEREFSQPARYYDGLLESLPDAIIMIDDKGKIVQINGQLETLFGYAKAELIGRRLELLMPERFRARHHRNVEEFIAHPRVRPMGTGLELFGLKKDGTEFPIDISLSTLKRDGDVLAMAAVRDITERKKFEHAIDLNYRIQKAISSVLKISLDPLSLEEKIDRVLELILTIPSFAMHSRGSVYLVEGEPETLILKAMRGFTVDQVAACRTASLGAEGPDETNAGCSIITTACLGEFTEIQYTETPFHGQYCVPILYNGKIIGLINVAVMEGHTRDADEEEFLSAISDALAGLVERSWSEAEKNQLREQLAESEKLAALGRITANVSHTIKNPLTAVGGFANRLVEKLPEGSREREYAGRIFEASVRLENILQNVLLFSRRDSGHREELDLSAIGNKALNLYEDVLAEKGIQINRVFHTVPQVMANGDQVLQALENLLSNAVDAMSAGGTLTVETGEKTIGSVSYASLTVQDTGEGIELADVDRIFEPFFTTKVLKKGTGLGLSITQKVLEEHGGFIRVKSEKGSGTTFTLYFPCAQKTGERAGEA